MDAILGLSGLILLAVGCYGLIRGRIPRLGIHSRAGGGWLVAAGFAVLCIALIWSMGRSGVGATLLLWSFVVAIVGLVGLIRGKVRQFRIASRRAAGGTLAAALVLFVGGVAITPTTPKPAVASAVSTATPNAGHISAPRSERTTAITALADAPEASPLPATSTPPPPTSTPLPPTATPVPPTSTPVLPTVTPNRAATVAAATAIAKDAQAVQHLGAGNTLLQAGNLPGAMKEYSAAQALSPNRPDVQSAVGTAQARVAQATAQAKAKAVTDHLGAAHSFEQAANYDAAAKEYDAVLSLDPQNADAAKGKAAVVATATAIAMHRDATATAQAQALAATATAQANAAAAAATVQAQAAATAQVQALVNNPPPGTYQANDGSVAVAVGDFRYVKQFGIYQAAPGARYIACVVGVGGRDSISVNPLYFTLVLADGTSYSVDDGMFAYWSNPLNPTEVPAGGHAEGGILFLVKDGVAPKELIYKPIQIFNFTNIVVDLTKPSK